MSCLLSLEFVVPYPGETVHILPSVDRTLTLMAPRQSPPRSDVAITTADWNNRVLPVLTQLVEAAGLDAEAAAGLTLDAYRNAASLVASRSFAVDEFHGDSMVPVADIFNHKASVGESRKGNAALSLSASSSVDMPCGPPFCHVQYPSACLLSATCSTLLCPQSTWKARGRRSSTSWQTDLTGTSLRERMRRSPKRGKKREKGRETARERTREAESTELWQGGVEKGRGRRRGRKRKEGEISVTTAKATERKHLLPATRASKSRPGTKRNEG